MEQPSNSYVPTDPHAPPNPEDLVYHYPDAGLGKRFLNNLIDGIANNGITIAIFFGIESLVNFAPAHSAQGLQDFFQSGWFSFFFSYALVTLYYVLFEHFTGRSLGKLITNTLVLTEDNEKPSLGQIVGRSVARHIPFEPFSFFRSIGRGWHDTLSKTKVVDTKKPPTVLVRNQKPHSTLERIIQNKES